MATLKSEIFTLIREKLPLYVKYTDEELDKIVFHTHENIRLSQQGYKILSALKKSHSFEIPQDLSSKHSMALSVLSGPFYRTVKRIYIFSDEDALMIKVSGGIEQFLDKYVKQH